LSISNSKTAAAAAVYVDVLPYNCLVDRHR
jgi:hypothetical protein